MHTGFEVFSFKYRVDRASGTQNDIGSGCSLRDGPRGAEFLPKPSGPLPTERLHIAGVWAKYTDRVYLWTHRQKTHQLCAGLPTGPYDGRRLRIFLCQVVCAECAGGADAHPLNHTIRHDRQRLPRLGREHQN